MAAEAEKLKLRIHELQSELQKRDHEDRSNNLKNSEGYQGLVNKYTQELSVQQEQILKLERSIVARESQIKVVTKDLEEQRSEAIELNRKLTQVTGENDKLKAEAVKMVVDIEALRKSTSQTEVKEKLLSDQLNKKERLCMDAESSMKHLTRTLEDLKSNFEGAKQHSELVMADNDQLRAENRTLNSNIEAYKKQTESLRSFIEELEINNKELVRFIDNRTFVQANDYKAKVASVLNRPRQGGQAVQASTNMQAPQQLAEVNKNTSH